MSSNAEQIKKYFENAFSENRKALTEAEVYDIFDLFKLNTPKRVYIKASDISKTDINGLLKSIPSDKAVVKVCSSKTLHKTESGGVKICSKSETEETIKQMAEKFTEAEGILLCEFIPFTPFALGQELMLGARYDDAFGPVVTLGIGGTDAEHLTSSLREGYSPLIVSVTELKTDEKIKQFIENAWIWKYTAGKVRGGKKLAESKELARWIKAFVELTENFDGQKDWLIDEVEINPLAVSDGKITALDGVLRFDKKEVGKRTPPSAKGIWSLLKPETVAVAGVSESKMNMGRIILNNIVKAGFEKENLFVLKNYDGKVDDVKCFSSCKDFPKSIDMFVVAVPSSAAADVLRDAAVSGKVRGVVLISGGMGEKKGTENTKAEVVEIIKQAKEKNADFCLSGGNSLGIVSNPSKVNTLFIQEKKLPAPIGKNPNMAETAFISQSGAFLITAASKMPWFKPAYSVSVGNQMDVTVVDYLYEVCKDKNIKVVLGYIEGFKSLDGLKLIEAVNTAVKSGKKVVLYKAGRTTEGQKSVMGHTASIAGSYTVFKSLLKKTGAYIADTFEEFEDFIQLCCYYSEFNSKTGKVFLLSNAGFESAGMADNLDKKYSLKTEEISGELTDKLKNILKKYKLDGIVDVKNPFDVTPMASDDAILELTETILRDGQSETVIISPIPLTPAMRTLPEEGLDESLPVKLSALSKKYKKPVIFCVAAGTLYDEYCKKATDSGLSVFHSSDRALKMLSRFVG